MLEFFNHFADEFRVPLRNPVLIFSLILMIILLSPIVLRRLNIPGIIGLILSGILIGPHGLHLLENDQAIKLFSTIGLLYIMFIAGLELDLGDFKSNRNRSLLFGLFTFAIPMGLGYPVCRYFLEFDFNASLLTASMFATHTLVAYPIVSKFGVSKNQAVAVTVGGTILTDTAVLILLAVIMGRHEGSLSNQFWITLGISLIMFSVIMFMVIPRIAKWFFRKMESEKHSHYIFVLAVVFFAAFLAEVAGVEPIIGAFMAGLALNKLIPHSSALMNRIEFIGNALFIPFFLISVGMVVDLKVVLNGYEAWVVAGTLSVVALLGKWIAAWLAQISFGYSSAQRGLIFGLSASHAAATLAVILVGYNAGILDENILNGTIILILITCITASFATQQAAKKIAAESADVPVNESATRQRDEHILIPAEQLSGIEKLLELAILIKDKKSANPISLLSVVSNDEEAERNILRAQSKLEDFVRQGSAAETRVNIITTIDHNTAAGIGRISREIMAGLVVVDRPSKKSLIEDWIGEKMRLDNLVAVTDKVLFVCHLIRQAISYRRILLTAPPSAEREPGFSTIVNKMLKLAKELSIPIEVYGNTATITAIESLAKAERSSVMIRSHLFDDWEDYLVLSKEINDHDLLATVLSRKGSTSHSPIIDKLPGKIEKHFEANNTMLIYPGRLIDHHYTEAYEDISAEPLNKGIETIRKLGKGIENIFKK